MKLRNPWLIRLAGLTAAAGMRCWLSTLQVRIRSEDGRKHPTDPRRDPFIYVFWHEALLAPTTLRAPAQVLISHHADGELIAQVCRHLRIGVIRGSTKRGGTQALMEMLGRRGGSHLVITPDGPRGPRRQVQMGAIFLASHTGLSIVPIGVGFSHAWRAKSWDRFAVPFPGSAITGHVGVPLAVPPNLDRAGLETYRLQLEQQLGQVTEQAEQWAAGLS